MMLVLTKCARPVFYFFISWCVAVLRFGLVTRHIDVGSPVIILR